ncbi:DUF3325 domain-containing protein [Sphingomonas flavalba]|uniref:DUF3325 domain-containing protein n=1 Tax=Sphingomonas flavalba TaxID=2559804 RepID=UPI0039E158C8
MTALIAALLLLFAGFLAFALAMQRHQRDLAGRPLSRPVSRLARVGGWALLTLALIPLVAGFGAAFGAVLWLALVTPAAMLVVLLLTYRGIRWRG